MPKQQKQLVTKPLKTETRWQVVLFLSSGAELYSRWLDNEEMLDIKKFLIARIHFQHSTQLNFLIGNINTLTLDYCQILASCILGYRIDHSDNVVC